jgi:flavin reductase (DIM6/NTAB) family NADH-FMN oxidoreductase RutF
METSFADACRTLMSGFPTGVAVVTSMSAGGEPCGLTCNSLISVTLAPPTLLVSLNMASRTYEATLDSGGFAVNVLPARASQTAVLFSSRTADRFASVGWEPCGSLGLPRLAESSGWAECVLADVVVVADHALVIGQVSDARSTLDVPLLYGFRQYAAWHPQPDMNLT